MARNQTNRKPAKSGIKNHSPTVISCESYAAYLRLCCGALLTVASLDDHKAVKETVDEIVRIGACFDETIKELG